MRIEAVEFRGRAYWQVRLGRCALRFPHEAAAQLHTRREWLIEQRAKTDGLEPSPEQ